MKIKRISLLALVLIFLVTTGQSCFKGGNQAAQQAANEKINLTYWRVFEGENDFDEIISAYREIHPNININIVKKRYEEYEDELVQAFAEDRGPDMFSIHNTWMEKYEPLITPLPESLNLVYLEVQGTLQKETVAVIREEKSLTINKLKNDYVDVVADDVVRRYQASSQSASENRIWGLPYSVDTLALFYNKDLLNAAGIPEPPATWSDFQSQVKELTLVDLDGGIVQSGAAIGTTENVERAVDIVSILMMQNGTQMMSGNRAYFAEVPTGSTSRTPPAIDAVRFYTDFANPIKEVYTWNEDMEDSFDAFANGTTAFFFGYAYHIPQLRARNPKLNFEIAPVPQIENSRTVNFANYWIEVVAKDTEHLNEAWDFIQYTAEAENVIKFLESADKPTALRSLINTQLDDLDLSVFASQVLTADDWYDGEDAEAAEEALLNFVEDVLTGAEDLEKELRKAQSQVNQTL